MGKIFSALKYLSIGSLLAIGLAIAISLTGMWASDYGYAAPALERGAEGVIQPFELTNPAATREEAYDEIAELNKDPKALIKAENKEEQAQEELLKEESKIIKSDRK